MSRYLPSNDTASLQVIEQVTDMSYILELSTNKNTLDINEEVVLSGRLTRELFPDAGMMLPVPGARIRLAQHIITEAGENWLDFGVLTTNSGGYFEGTWEMSQSGDYEIRAEYQSSEGLVISDSVFLSVYSTIETEISAELEDSTIYLGDSFTVYGRVVDLDGNPVPAGLRVRVSVVGISPSFSVYTDDLGNYSCTVNSAEAGITRPGNYQILASFDGGYV